MHYGGGMSAEGGVTSVGGDMSVGVAYQWWGGTFHGGWHISGGWHIYLLGWWPAGWWHLWGGTPKVSLLVKPLELQLIHCLFQSQRSNNNGCGKPWAFSKWNWFFFYLLWSHFWTIIFPRRKFQRDPYSPMLETPEIAWRVKRNSSVIGLKNPQRRETCRSVKSQKYCFPECTITQRSRYRHIVRILEADAKHSSQVVSQWIHLGISPTILRCTPPEDTTEYFAYSPSSHLLVLIYLEKTDSVVFLTASRLRINEFQHKSDQAKCLSNEHTPECSLQNIIFDV